MLALDAVILLIVIREYQVLRREARADQRTERRDDPSGRRPQSPLTFFAFSSPSGPRIRG